MPMSRREALETGWKVGGGLLAGSAVWTTVEALRPLAVEGGAGVVKLSGGFSEGTATLIREGRFYVSNVRGHLFALSQTCPHLGCRVPFCASSGRFECPCHGSIFNLAGEWITGPSPRGLDRFAMQDERGRLAVDLGTMAAGPAAGVHAFDLPAQGAGCSSGTGTGTSA